MDSKYLTILDLWQGSTPTKSSQNDKNCQKYYGFLKDMAKFKLTSFMDCMYSTISDLWQGSKPTKSSQNDKNRQKYHGFF